MTIGGGTARRTAVGRFEVTHHSSARESPAAYARQRSCHAVVVRPSGERGRERGSLFRCQGARGVASEQEVQLGGLLQFLDRVRGPFQGGGGDHGTVIGEEEYVMRTSRLLGEGEPSARRGVPERCHRGRGRAAAVVTAPEVSPPATMSRRTPPPTRRRASTPSISSTWAAASSTPNWARAARRHGSGRSVPGCGPSSCRPGRPPALPGATARWWPDRHRGRRARCLRPGPRLRRRGEFESRGTEHGEIAAGQRVGDDVPDADLLMRDEDVADSRGSAAHRGPVDQGHPVACLRPQQAHQGGIRHGVERVVAQWGVGEQLVMDEQVSLVDGTAVGR